jgi:Putative prokaryotic signal transducing protein
VHSDDDGPSGIHHPRSLVELTRVQPIEAEVITARLRASGIPARVGADSIYPSVTVADGVPVFVSEEDAPRARALLEGDDEPY